MASAQSGSVDVAASMQLAQNAHPLLNAASSAVIIIRLQSGRVE